MQLYKDMKILGLAKKLMAAVEKAGYDTKDSTLNLHAVSIYVWPDNKVRVYAGTIGENQKVIESEDRT